MKNVTEVQIIPIKPKDGLIALASVVIDNSLYLGSIGVHLKLDGSGYRITYPTKKVAEKSFNIYHPIDKDTSKAIEDAITKKVKEII